jgi:hypothetical protein
MKIKSIIIATAVFILSNSAFAGLTQPAPVDIDLVNRIASGDMVTARFSDNPDEFIGCGSRRIGTGVGAISFAFCQARLAPGVDGLAFCNTLDEELVKAINSIADFSFVTFSWNVDGECTRIGNSTQSFYLPNFKLKK